MNEDNPLMMFDWYFTDVSRRDAARFHALAAKKAETSVLMNLIRANSLVHFALWSELPKNHPVGELWLETQTDLLASIYLAYGGFFRQALAILRCWFEIAVFGVFFSAHYGQETARYEQWRHGERRVPTRMEHIAESLASRQDMVERVDETTLLGKLKPIHSFLSQHTHAQSLDVHGLQNGRDNVPRFLSKSYDIWYTKTREVFDAICFLYRIFFPNEIGSYFKGSDAEIDRIRKATNSLKSLPNLTALVKNVLTIIGEN